MRRRRYIFVSPRVLPRSGLLPGGVCGYGFRSPEGISAQNVHTAGVCRDALRATGDVGASTVGMNHSVVPTHG